MSDASSASTGSSTRNRFTFAPSESDPLRGVSPGTMTEWPPSYAAQYPHNNAKQTSSGHLLEFDDTPGAERIHVYHRSGSHIELRPDGNVKYSCKKSRQDVTIGDHEIMVNGDFKLSVAGNINIRVRDGEFQLQADNGLAINVKGQLKMSADEINLRARDKIVLAAPAVDIGGVGSNSAIPLLSLPSGIVPIFGVLVPRITGVLSPKAVLDAAVPPTVSGALGQGVSLTNIIDKFKTMVTVVSSMAKQMTIISAYASAAGLGVGLAKQLLDAKGKNVVAEIPPPQEIPLTNPRVYNCVGVERSAFRDRMFDEPAQVDNTDSYVSHLDIMAQLSDFTGDAKELPGQPDDTMVDTTTPADEPPPWTAYPDRGTVRFEQGNTVVRGTGTAFTEDYAVGTYLTFEDAPFAGADSLAAFPRVATVVDDTTLLLSAPYPAVTAENVVPKSFRYRAFSQYADRTTFALTEPLGGSGVVLADFMINYLPPVVERLDLPIPASQLPTPPLASGDGGTGSGITPGDPPSYETRPGELLR